MMSHSNPIPSVCGQMLHIHCQCIRIEPQHSLELTSSRLNPDLIRVGFTWQWQVLNDARGPTKCRPWNDTTCLSKGIRLVKEVDCECIRKGQFRVSEGKVGGIFRCDMCS